MNAADRAAEKAFAQEQKRKAQQAARVDKMQRGESLTPSETQKYIEFFPVGDRGRAAYEAHKMLHLQTAILYMGNR